MSGSVSLTLRTIDAIGPAEKRRYYYDSQTPGLELMVTPNGAKVFYFKYRASGVSNRVRIGPHPRVTPAIARKRAAQLGALVTLGTDPALNIAQGRAELTLTAAFAEYMSRHARPHKKSADQDQGLFDRHLAKWARRRISAITHGDVQRLHARIGQRNGKYAANRVLALVNTVYGKLAAWGYFKGDSPAKGVQRFKEHSRQRFLSQQEIGAFLAALDEEPDQVTADMLRMCLLTGARKGNVMAMRWDQLDHVGDRAVWTIPDTKGGHPVDVAMSAEAIAVLQRRRDAGDGGPWVFQADGPPGHVEDPKRAFVRACKTAGIENANVHTLRHTFASWMTMAGFNLQIVGKALGHRSLRSTQVYAHLTLEPVRVATQATANLMTALDSPVPSKENSDEEA